MMYYGDDDGGDKVDEEDWVLMFLTEKLRESRERERVENLIIVGEDEQRQVWKQQLHLSSRSIIYYDALGASNIFAIMCR